MSESEATLSLVLKARNLATREVDKLHKSLGRVKTGAGKLAGGLKTLATVGMVGLAGAAIAVVGALGAAAKAAMEEQVGIKRLQSALKANVKGWKDHTGAIDKAIDKAEGLAFADDEVRDSLAYLVTKTKDVDKALKIQAVAMDVARLKGISLKDASVLVSKGMAGNTKVLKELGIELKEGATKQEILAAIQKKAAGQAKAYGETAQGAMESFQIAIGNVVEDVGSALLPIVTQAFTWLRAEGVPAVRAIIEKVQKWISENRGLFKWLGKLFDTIGKVVGELIEKLKPAFEKIINTVVEKLFPAIQKLIDVLWGDGKGPVPKALRFVADIMVNVLLPAVDAVIGIISDLIGWLADAIDKLTDFLGLSKSAARVGKGLGEKDSNSGAKGHHRGGWVGLHGPEIGLLGERGPEYIIPNHELGRAGTGGGVTIRGVSERELVDMIDRGLYFRLSRAATGR